MSGHAVAQGAHFAAADGQDAAIEEPDRRSGFPNDLLDEFHRIGTLNLVSIRLTDNRTLSRNGALVQFEPDVVAAGLRVVPNPIVNRRTADDVEQVLGQMNENHIADHVSVVVAHDELLGFVHVEIFKTIDAEVGEKLQRARSLNIHVRHVIGLVEENTRVLPGVLLVAPVGVFRWDNRIDIRARLRIPQKCDGPAGGF